MRDTSIAWLNDHPLVADLPIVQKTRLRQMLLGTIDLSDEDEVVFPEDTESVKFEALLKIIEREPGEKILVRLWTPRKYRQFLRTGSINRG